jgi:hypothetical protein
MRKVHAAALATLAFFLVPAALSAQQSLADAAAKEKERRKTVKGAKSFTEDDLGRTGGGQQATTEVAPVSSEASGAKEGEAAKPAKKEKSEEELKAEQSAAWRKKVEVAQNNVQVYKDQVNKLQLDLNDSSGGFYSSRRTTLVTHLDETKKNLADAEKTLSDLEDEGRRNGYR